MEFLAIKLQHLKYTYECYVCMKYYNLCTHRFAQYDFFKQLTTYFVHRHCCPRTYQLCSNVSVTIYSAIIFSYLICFFICTLSRFASRKSVLNVSDGWRWCCCCCCCCRHYNNKMKLVLDLRHHFMMWVYTECLGNQWVHHIMVYWLLLLFPVSFFRVSNRIKSLIAWKSRYGMLESFFKISLLIYSTNILSMQQSTHYYCSVEIHRGRRCFSIIISI